MSAITIHPQFATPASVWDLLQWAGHYPDARAVVEETERRIKASLDEKERAAFPGLRAWLVETGDANVEWARAGRAHAEAVGVMKEARRAAS